MKLCRNIFRGMSIKAEDVDERDPEYAQYIRDTRKSKDMVVRERKEVIQHAKALEFLVHAMVDNSQPLTVDLIKTHTRYFSKANPEKFPTANTESTNRRKIR